MSGGGADDRGDYENHNESRSPDEEPEALVSPKPPDCPDKDGCTDPESQQWHERGYDLRCGRRRDPAYCDRQRVEDLYESRLAEDEEKNWLADQYGLADLTI